MGSARDQGTNAGDARDAARVAVFANDRLIEQPFAMPEGGIGGNQHFVFYE
ncbi:MAG TPA: hypothetical protein VNE82_06525 [Candidatus Binataceae bacterium]|nr:hypothetical protein [Candidatus Binataceae bacterium]